MSTHRSALRTVRRVCFVVTASILLLVPGSALATLITSASDPALSGALVEDFDSYSPAYFTSQDFLTGTDGFNVAPVSNELHIDNTYCGSFGTTGSCLDTIRIGGAANDDFDVVFTGAGVSAFGFALNALDTDWTIETYDASDVLLNSYTVASQSPGLTGFARRGYFGATEFSAIKSVRIRSAGSDRALIDDFAFVPVPEPGTAILAGLGLIGLASIGRKELR